MLYIVLGQKLGKWVKYGQVRENWSAVIFARRSLERHNERHMLETLL